MQAYYDHTERRDALLYSPQVDIVDLEFQHGFEVRNHRLLWGAGHRRSRDDIQPGVFFGFVPASRTMRWTNVFVQDEVALGERVGLTVGTKLENNDYTGTETLPSVRLSWKASGDRLAWAALSRAVRAPARLDRDLVLPPTPPYIIAGGPGFVSEVADVAELGWRAQASPDFNYSVTLFHHEWSRLRSGQPPPNAHVQNMIAGHTQGVETWAAWQASAWLRLSAGATVLRKRLHILAGSTDPVGPAALGDDPSHQWSVRASFNLPRRQDLDVALRHVGALPVAQVPSYTAVDARYAWLLRDGLELSLVGQNLFDRAHAEFGNAGSRSEIGRSIALRLRWTM